MVFDTQVQELKYQALKEVAALAWEDNLARGLLGSPAGSFPALSPPCAAASTRSGPSWKNACAWPWAAIRKTTM